MTSIAKEKACVDAYKSSGNSPPVSVEDEFARYIASQEMGVREATLARVKGKAMNSLGDAELDSGSRRFRWADYDYDSPPPAPRFVVDRLLERQTVNLISGDTGTAKSFILMALAVAAATGAEWLGRNVLGSRVIYVDEENPSDVAHERLRALGMSNRHRDSLRYSNRVGARIGAGNAWAEELRREAEEFQPDLIVIDTALAALDVEVNENDLVAALYTSTLRPLASDLGAAVVIAHHERKGRTDGARGGMDAMGARSWAGQADTHLTLKLDDAVTEGDGERPGHRKVRSTFTMRLAKSRRGQGFPAETVALTSEKDQSDRLLWAKVASEGTAADDRRTLAQEIAAVVENAGEPIRRMDLAAEVGRSSNDGTFDRALKLAKDGGLVVRDGARWTAPDAGALPI